MEPEIETGGSWWVIEICGVQGLGVSCWLLVGYYAVGNYVGAT